MKVIRVIGYVAMAYSLFKGLVGIIVSLISAQNLDADRQYHIAKDGKNYEVRRFPHHGWDDVCTTYAFDVYRESGPFELSLPSFSLDDCVDHWGFQSELQFHILDTQKHMFLVVTDTEGHRYSQQLQ